MIKNARKINNLTVGTRAKSGDTSWNINSMPKYEMFKHAETTNDPYWDDIIKKAAEGILPEGFLLLGSDSLVKLSYKKIGSNRNTSINIPKNSDDAVKILISVLKENGHESPSEKKKEDEEILEVALEIKSWSDVSSASQINILRFYSMDLIEKHHLNREESKKLDIVLNTGINNGSFNKTNIKLKSNRIERIENLVWNEEERRFIFNGTIPNKKSGKPTIKDPQLSKDMKPKIVPKMHKFLNSIYSKHTEHNKRSGNVYVSDRMTVEIPSSMPRWNSDDTTNVTTDFEESSDEE
jgi:hypothetical protein